MAVWCDITYDFKWPGISNTRDFARGKHFKIPEYHNWTGDGNVENRDNYTFVDVMIYDGPVYIDMPDGSADFGIILNYGDFNKIIKRLRYCIQRRKSVDNTTALDYCTGMIQCWGEDKELVDYFGREIPSSVDLVVEAKTYANGMLVDTKSRVYEFVECYGPYGPGDYTCEGYMNQCPCPPKLVQTCCDHVPKDYIVWLDDLYHFSEMV